MLNDNVGRWLTADDENPFRKVKNLAGLRSDFDCQTGGRRDISHIAS
jgi:hypothetical protein